MQIYKAHDVDFSGVQEAVRSIHDFTKQAIRGQDRGPLLSSGSDILIDFHTGLLCLRLSTESVSGL
jgi:hypothetical protein